MNCYNSQVPEFTWSRRQSGTSMTYFSLWLPQAAKANTPEVETLALGSAEMFLGLADSILDHAQKMLDTYGSHVVAIG